jgi:hypothetical protein
MSASGTPASGADGPRWDLLLQKIVDRDHRRRVGLQGVARVRLARAGTGAEFLDPIGEIVGVDLEDRQVRVSR